MNGIEIKLKKQPQKYLAGVDEPTRRKLFKALDQLSRLEDDEVLNNETTIHARTA